MEDSELNTGLFKWRKTVLWFLGVAFVSVSMLGFGVDLLGGADNKRYAVKLGETQITHDQFYRARRELEEQYRAFLGPKYQEVLEASGQSINQIVADKLMNEAALDNAAKQYGLAVGRELAAQKLFEQLFPEGYDAALYRRFLQQKGLTAVQQEEQVARELTRAQIADVLKGFAAPASKEYTAEVARDLRKFDVVAAELAYDGFKDEPVSDAELQQYYDSHQDDLRTPVKISYEALVVDPDSFPKAIEIPSEAIELYYAEHQDEFKNPEARKVSLIEINSKDSEGDNKGAELIKRREAALEQLKSGKSFKDVSDLFNDNQELKKLGGEKGWVTREELASEVAGKVFDAEMKTASLEPEKQEPIVVSSADSEKIFLIRERKEASTKTLEEVRASIITYLQKEQAPALLSAKAEELFASWKDSNKSLSDLGQEVGVKVLEVKDVTAAPIQGDTSSKALKDVSSLPDERLASVAQVLLEEMDIQRRVVELKGASALVEIKEVKDPFVAPLNDLKPLITAKLKEQKSKVKAKEVADQLLKGLKDGQFADVRTAAAQLKVPVRELKSLVVSDAAKELGAVEFARELEGSTEVAIAPSKVYSTKAGYLVAQTMALHHPTSEDVAAKVKEERESILEQEQNLIVQAFVARYKAKVEKDVDASLF